MMDKIASYPFVGVFEKIGSEESQYILEQIQARD
jgi:hypothetical protein